MQVVETKVENRQVEDSTKAVDGSLQSVRNHLLRAFPGILNIFRIGLPHRASTDRDFLVG
jgi:hypothetical protein